MNINQKLYYKRSYDKPILKSGDQNNLKVGDVISYHGNLYLDEFFLKQVANTHIQYEILLILNNNTVLMNTSNEYTFVNNSMPSGTLLFEGRVLAHNFRIDNSEFQTYSTEPAVLSLFDSSDDYLYSIGMSDYVINGQGTGHVNIHISVIQ